MTDDAFNKLAMLYGFAPSRALRELVEAGAALAQQTEPCPNCASLERQNSELDRKLAELAVEVARFIEQARGII